MKIRYALLLLIIPGLLLLPVILPLTSAQPGILFQKTWGGVHEDAASNMALDSSGNVYLVGSTNANFTYGCLSGTCSDILLLKYGPTGNLLLHKTWGGADDDFGAGIALDPLGNIYVAGTTASYGTGGDCGGGVTCSDIVLLKLDYTGNVIWQKTWGAVNQTDSAFALSIDKAGNLYITGITDSSGAGLSDAVIIKFDSSGNPQWQMTWGGGSNDFGQGIVVDASENVYVTGRTSSFTLGQADVFLLKLDPSGAVNWQSLWGGTKNDLGIGVTLDPSNTIYVTGGTLSTGAGSRDLFLLSLDSTGGLIWQRTWGGIGDDSGSRIVLDPSGSVDVSGYTESYGANPLISHDISFLKFSKTGSLQSHNTWGGAGDDFDGALAVDGKGNLFIGGNVNESSPYSMGTAGNSTLGMPTFTIRTTGNSTSGAPNLILGTTLVPTNDATGSETYGGQLDAVLFKYGVSQAIIGCGSTSCAVTSNATITGTSYISSNHTLQLSFEGATGSHGFANVTVAKSAVYQGIGSNIRIIVDGDELAPSEKTITMNSTHFFVYFTFTFHSQVQAQLILFPLSLASTTPLLSLAVLLLIIPTIFLARRRIKS